MKRKITAIDIFYNTRWQTAWVTVRRVHLKDYLNNVSWASVRRLQAAQLKIAGQCEEEPNDNPQA